MSHQRRIPNAAPLALALLAAVAAGRATAQADGGVRPGEITPQPQQIEQGVSTHEARQFAQAVSALKDRQADTDAQLESADDPSEVERIHEEAEREMRWAIEDTGLTVQRYQQILIAYRQDPALQREVMQYFREAE